MQYRVANKYVFDDLIAAINFAATLNTEVEYYSSDGEWKNFKNLYNNC